MTNPKTTNQMSDQRLQWLRTIAEPNEIPQISPYKSKKLQTSKQHTASGKSNRKFNKRHKPVRQLMSDEFKRINTYCAENKKVPKVTCYNIVAPPSLKPNKKYCDITGLNGPYKSVTNNIRYHNAEIYQLIVKPMAPGVDQEYLKLRNANFVLK